MNSSTLPRSRRAALAVATVQLGGLALLAGALAGCGRRPIIVQTPAPTVIQNPTPAPTVIQNPAPVVATTPAPALPPTGRDVIVIKEAPPPPREEVPPPPPSERYTWLPGYWTSRDGRQEWVPGRWEMPPRTGATWVSPRWERRGEGYVFTEGYWR